MKTSDYNKVSALEAYVLYCLMKLKPCNLEYIVANIMNYTLNANKPMKYGLLLFIYFNSYPCQKHTLVIPL